MSIYKGTRSPCQINKSTGNISIKWPSPIDKSLNAHKEDLLLLNYPLEFFVAIHQKTNTHHEQFIGQGERHNSKI